MEVPYSDAETGMEKNSDVKSYKYVFQITRGIY